ncbi:MAG: DUF6765 family protein, partial [Parachlamydiaceae bacterium]
IVQQVTKDFMNIDFHYGMIYTVARLAGMRQEDAQIVAHACQYIDDATTHGILEFEGGETFERFSSAHKLFDYANMLNDQNRVVWAPFHFLPAGEGGTIEEKSICRPDSVIAKDMVRRAIKGSDAKNALHRLGVSLHVYVDTWAHKGFTGMISNHNIVLTLQGDDHNHDTWIRKLKGLLSDAGHNIEALGLDAISRLGHGAALHFPDMPWAKWHYKNGHGQEIDRDNLPDFVEAADMACKVVQGFIKNNEQYEQEKGLSEKSKAAIKDLLAGNRDHDEVQRLEFMSAAVANGKISGIQEEIPFYIAKGKGSWKHAATGIVEIHDGPNKPIWSEVFENSHYRKFHDAVKEHRFVVTQEILPAHGVRLA